MKVIVTYASAGRGHLKAAEAIYNYLKERCPEIELQLIDILEKTNSFFNFNYIWSYNFIIRHVLILWYFLFWITSVRPLRKVTRLIISFINTFNTSRFSKFLIQENPDFIISTHFFPSEISARLKKIKKIKSKVISVITDFGVHPLWISRGTDIYIVASHYTKQKLLIENIPQESIYEFGIPVDFKFLKQYSRIELANKIGIDAHKFTVLIMTGSFGIGPLEDIVRMLYRQVQVLVVCANNKKLYTDLKKANLDNVKIFGFIDNPEELMAISDLIITKPGGLSIAEILAMELIPVFISAIPGQETENVRALRQYNVGLSPKSIKEIEKIVLDFKNHPDKLMIMKENIKKISKPFCLKEICDVICQSSIRITG
jgi:processive 1,2-diacylglycerol beta-glucosyltransferase